MELIHYPDRFALLVTSKHDPDNPVELDVTRDGLWIEITDLDRQTVQLDREACIEVASVLLHYAVHGMLPPKPAETTDGGN